MAGLGLRALATAFPRIVPRAAPNLARFIPGISEEAAAPAVAYGQRAIAPSIVSGAKWTGAGGLRAAPMSAGRTLGSAVRKYPKTFASMPLMPFMGQIGGGEDPQAPGGFIGPIAPPTYPGAFNAQSEGMPPGGAIAAASGLYNELTGAAGAGPGDAPDFLNMLNDPRVLEYVDKTVANLQAPYARMATKRQRGGDKQVGSIEGAGKESQRMGKALRMEERASRTQYSQEAQARQESSVDQLGDIADRLIGSSNVDAQFDLQRGEQALEATGRTGEAMARESSLGAGGSLDISSVMSDLDASEAMQTARDVKDAREQTRLDVDEINAKIADIAGQQPELARSFAQDMYQSEMNKYQADSQSYNNKLGALSDFYIAISKQQSEASGSDFDMSKWINQKQDETYGSLEMPTPDGLGKVRQSIKPMAELQRNPQQWNAFLEQHTALVNGNADPSQAAEWLYGQWQQQMTAEFDSRLGIVPPEEDQ